MSIELSRFVVVARVNQGAGFLAALRGPNACVAVRVQVGNRVAEALARDAAQKSPFVALPYIEIAGQVEALKHGAIG
ncbi:hypothetical protein D9M68_967430 [compost metagenome]